MKLTARKLIGRTARLAILFLLAGGPLGLHRALADDGDLARADALNRQAIQFYQQGNYAAALPLAEQVLELRQKVLAPDDLAVAAALNNVARLDQLAGRFADAETLMKRALSIKEQKLGAEHLDVTVNLNNLAALYVDEGRYAEAEPLLARSLAIREKVLGPDDPDVAMSLNNLAVLYKDRGRLREAEPLLQRSLAIREKRFGADNADVAASLNNLAALYEDEGRSREAEPLFQQSLEIREKTLGPEHPDLVPTLNNLAMLYDGERRFDDAEALYKRSLAIREKAFGADHPSVALALNNLAALYDEQGRYDEAEKLYQRSLTIREQAFGPQSPAVGNSLNNLALLYKEQSRFAEAEPLYQRSLAISEAAYGAEHPEVAAALNNLAALYSDEGRSAEAEPLLWRTLAIREDLLGLAHPDVASALQNLAELYRRRGRTAEAYALSGRAMEIVAGRLAAGSATASDAAEQERFHSLFLLRASLAFATRDDPASFDAGFAAAQLADASSASQAVSRMTARFAAGDDALAQLVRQRQDLAQQRQSLDKAFVQAVGKPQNRRDPTGEAALRGQLDDVLRRLKELDAQIAGDFPRYAALTMPQPLAAADVQALLRPDEVLLVYLVGADNTWLWAVRRDRTAVYQLDIGATALASAVARLRDRLDPDLDTDQLPFDTKLSYALYQHVLGPAASFIAGAQNLLVVPDGALGSLPFGVLVTAPPDASQAADASETETGRHIAWLVRDHAVTVYPSVGAMQQLRRFDTAQAEAPLPFVGIGAPLLDGELAAARGAPSPAATATATADETTAEAVRQLPPLPETADELRAVARDMGATDKDLYLGDRASEPAIRQAGLDRYRVIEFATHGLVAGDLTGLGEPALVLTPPQQPQPDDDGLLTASKVATLHLDADWVVLSACNTAASDGTPDGTILSGLARSFFYAGARSVLVSSWAVPSAATVKLVTSAFGALRQNPSLTRAEALRQAELAMLDAHDHPELAEPMMWAPFILVGDSIADHR